VVDTTSVVAAEVLAFVVVLGLGLFIARRRGL
jgi:hypothetical protein